MFPGICVQEAIRVYFNNGTFFMKTFFKSLVLLVFFAFALAPTLARAQDDDSGGGSDGGGDDQDVSFQTFYDQLNNQGTWIQTDDYGYVFQPTVSDPEWQPYTDGGWVDSDAGLTWVSDEPWGWATYHYGRWANIDGLGWVWVPGYVWAPAWVSWRYGGDYCGWAPLPPETLYGTDYDDPGVNVAFGFHFGSDVDLHFHIGAGCYNFVRCEDIGERNCRGHIINRYNNYTIINNTTNVTNINVTHGGNHFHNVRAGGPPIAELNARARQHIQTVHLTQSNQPGRSTLQGNSLAVYAPRVNPATLHQARPGTVSQSITHPTFNRGDSIAKPFTVVHNIQAPAPTPQAIHAAEQAQAQAPATARIATVHTQQQTSPTRPFNSVTPIVTHTHNGGNPATGTHSAAQGVNNQNPNFNAQHQEHHNGGTFNSTGNQPNGANPSFHQEHQAPPAEVANPSVAPTPAPSPNPTYHQEHQGQPNNGGNPYTPPPNVYHPQNNGGGQNQGQQQHHTSQGENNGGNPQPTHNFQPQNNGGGQGGVPHPSNTPPNPGGNHPQGGGGQGGGNHSSGGGQGGGENHAAHNQNNPHPAAAPAPSGGNGQGNKDKKP